MQQQRSSAAKNKTNQLIKTISSRQLCLPHIMGFMLKVKEKSIGCQVTGNLCYGSVSIQHFRDRAILDDDNLQESASHPREVGCSVGWEGSSRGRRRIQAQVVKNLPAMRRPRFDPWVGKMPWRRAWQLTTVSLSGEPHGQWSLAGYTSWGCSESDMTERLSTAQHMAETNTRLPINYLPIKNILKKEITKDNSRIYKEQAPNLFQCPH